MPDLFEHASGPVPGIQLNPEQRAAVQHGEGPLVVVAGAGTGKTRVITERIRFLLESQQELTGNEILGLTFTDKAAWEMKHRVIAAARELGENAVERAEAVTLSTFHAFCYALLQEVNPELKPIDNIDHWILLRRNLPLLQLEQYRRLAEPGQFLHDFVEFFSRCQDELVTPDDYQRYADEQAENFLRVRGAMPEDERSIRDVEIAKLQEIARAYRASDLLILDRFAAGSRTVRDGLLRPLTLNYRSAGRILRVAGQAIRHNEKPNNIPEYPLTAVREDGEKVRIVTHASSEAEAKWVAGEFERLHRAGAKWRTFAVLYRGHAHRDKLVEALKARKIPFVIKNLSILSHRLIL